MHKCLDVILTNLLYKYRIFYIGLEIQKFNIISNQSLIFIN